MPTKKMAGWLPQSLLMHSAYHLPPSLTLTHLPHMSSSCSQEHLEDEYITNCFYYIYNYLYENEHESQFTLPKIHTKTLHTH